MPIPRDICTDPLMQGHLARRQDDAPFSRRQETVTSGYVTTDDWGSDGDDSVHNALPHYEIPAYFETRVKFPNETNPDTVDLVFLDL